MNGDFKKQNKMNNKITILYITTSLKRKSGITAVISNYLHHFDWHRFQVDILTFNDNEREFVDDLNALGANIFIMPRLGITSFWFFRSFLAEFFNEHHYKIVHSHFCQIDLIVFPIAKKNGTQICISHSHNSKLSDKKISAIRNRIMTLNIGNVADVWAACSEKAGECLFGKKYSESARKLIIRNGIDCKKYSFSQEKRNELRHKLGYNDNDIVIGHIGRFMPQKNHSYLIDILSELNQFNDKYKLVLIGDGPLLDSIKAKVKEKKLDRQVEFLGMRNDVHILLNLFDLFVFPSIYEGLGIVAIEAQANGLDCYFSKNVPVEANLTSVEFVDLEDSPFIWASKIHQKKHVHHPELLKAVENAGYDIRSSALGLQNYYENLLKKGFDSRSNT